MRQLFELCAADRDLRFSPFVLRVALCLKHKGLDYESMPRMFLEKDDYAESGSKAVPVLRDGDTWVTDSLEIAKYLEATYPENPLFGSDIALGQATFLNTWFNATVVGGLFPMIAIDVCNILEEENAKYFRKTREANLGCTLEEAAATRDERVLSYRESLGFMRATLAGQPFLSGDTPAWADYAAVAPFIWARIVAPDFALLAEDDPVYAWRERMLDLFDGFGRNVPTVG